MNWMSLQLAAEQQRQMEGWPLALGGVERVSEKSFMVEVPTHCESIEEN